MACAAGLRAALGGGPGGTWGPRLVGVFGAGLVMSDVFVPDAGAGFPPGAPAGAPEPSWHGVLHSVGFLVAVGGITAAAAALARRFVRSGERGWAAACAGAAVLSLVIVAWPTPDGLSVRLLVATAVQLAFVAALPARLLRVPDPVPAR